MTRDDVFDLAVVGAGPAGSVAAVLAARRGLRVALVDKATFPRDKVCGDGLSPGTVRVLAEAGLSEVFAGELPVHSVDIRGPDGVRLVGELPPVHGRHVAGYVVARAVFDDRLFRLALAAGALDLTGYAFEASHVMEDSRVVTLRRESGEALTIRARLLVGADGAYSTVRRSLGVPAAGATGSGIAMRAYGTCDAFDVGGAIGHHLVIEFGRDILPGYGWIFPTGHGSANIGVGIAVKDLRRRELRLRDLFNRYVEINEARGVALGPLHGIRSHQLPQIGTMPRLVHERAVLIGDAASMINPVSGEGIFYGVHAATSLVGRLPEALDGPDLQEHLHAFEQEFRATFRWHFQSVAAAYLMLRQPRWASVVLTAAGRDSRVLADALDMLFGAGRVKATTTARILRSGWARPERQG